jgi:hypothetical protein
LEDLQARREVEFQPSQDNNIRLQQEKAKFLKTKIQTTRRSWTEKNAFLNMKNDGIKLWRLTKKLNDESGIE